MTPIPTEETRIDRLDFDANRTARSHSSRSGQRSLLDDDVSFMNEIADAIVDRDRERMKREVTKALSFACAVLCCLCAGSITSFSLYGPRFLTDLHYTQYQVNAVSIVAELGMYLPVPLYGYLCDRYSPQPLALLASALFGAGYLLAAYTFKAGPVDAGGYPFQLMVVAFVGVGSGTSCMYLAAVATCAKNFSTFKYRGFMLAVPIASFGLSGMWQSLVGEHLLSHKLPNGRKGNVDVFKYFFFLAILLIVVGIIGFFALRIIDEEELIERGVEELEQSGLLDESQFFNAAAARRYGAINDDDLDEDADSTLVDNMTESQFLRKQEEDERLAQKKTWLLNHATHTFLTDRTMWLLGAGFFLLTGPAESYINNLGTIILTLTPAKYAGDLADPPAGHASTHVSIIAITSTFARLFTGTLSDLFAPPSTPGNPPSARVHFSRLVLLLPSAFILLLSFLNLAAPFMTPSNPSLFLLSSGLLGVGYGASFSLVPIIISVVWGAENFATNWGIICISPALGAALWSIIYSVNYSHAADEIARRGGQTAHLPSTAMVLGEAAKIPAGECRGYACFNGWAWGSVGSVAVAIVLWSMAWRVWRSRKVSV